MKPIQLVIKDLNAVIDALGQTPPASHQTLQDLLFKAHTDLIKATKTVLAIGDDPR